MSGFDLRTLVRSTLARTPRLFDLLSGPARFELLARFGVIDEPDFRALPRIVTRPDPLVLDVGANVGQSIIATTTVMPRARVVCFEPNPALHDLLARVVARRPAARLEPVGLGAVASTSTLFTPIYNGHVFPGLSSFDRAAAADWLSPSSLYGFDPDRLEIRESAAVVRTLDDFELAPDVVKIDVQGMEADVVRGGLETFRKHRPAVIAETISAESETFSLLAPLGYSLVEWDGRDFVPSTGARLNQILLP